MYLSRLQWTLTEGWKSPDESPSEGAQWVLVFGGPDCLEREEPFAELRARFPEAILVGCSTAGEIQGAQVIEEGLVATAVRFEDTRLRLREVELADHESSLEAGRALGRACLGEDLRHVFLLSDGLTVNGSELVAGLADVLPPEIGVTGGLSGDNGRFEATFVVTGDQRPRSGAVAAVCFHGPRLRVGHAALGGWDPFGPERVVTRAEGNVLYELGGRSALELYKEYLGAEAAEGLPATGLLFPLAVRRRGEETALVRTILGIDEEAGSLIFAGDIPPGSYARLMHANFDRLVEGAAAAAREALALAATGSPSLAILISCVGRKMVLGQRVEEELEAVQEVLGANALLTGFYSYGELSAAERGGRCELNNQTMSITLLSED